MVKAIRARIRQFFKAFQKRNIQYMISISFTIVAITGMLFLGMALYLRFAASTQNMVEEDNKRVINQVNMNIDVYLRNMMRISDAMYYRVIKNADLASDSIDPAMDLLYETNRDLLVSIVLVDDDGQLVAASPLSKLKKTVRPQDQEWFIRAMGKIENLHFSAPHVQNLFEDPDFRYRWVVSLSRAVELTFDGNVRHGVLLVDMNFSGIEQLFKNVTLGGNGYVYLIDSNGEIIYHPRQQLIFSNLTTENNLTAAGYQDGNHLENYQGDERVVTVKTVGYTGWKIVGVTPVDDITSSYYHFRAFAVFILFFTIFLMIFANLFVSSRIADPIKRLEASVKKLEQGDLSVKIAIGGSYEIQHLGKTIRSMVAQMRKLMDDIVVEQESKRKSELDALQSQINPHFLYNTLDSIIWMIENERYPEAISMVTALARLFRISLSKGRNIIPLSDELEHARNYMTIQQMRYKNKFTFKIDAAPETLRLSTIKLIVQPLLENAIYHGMEFMDGDGELLVKTYLLEDGLYVDVIDNGSGIPAEICRTLLTDETRVRSKGSGIGLRNVHQRIQLTYGKNYGLTILSEPDVGTTVRIRLPKVPFDTPDTTKEVTGR
ncbi:sensor histidine kinase [Anaerotruncus rubiinfantis]|uniref:sensor histidine kinase n=1 Tax=Anaerotruncus rubiinfantis TaxID=1720200 RepID=UPI00082B6C6E|nr:cache domain-containing protein [Anaerotruncus rubiinfantis]